MSAAWDWVKRHPYLVTAGVVVAVAGAAYVYSTEQQKAREAEQKKKIEANRIANQKAREERERKKREADEKAKAEQAAAEQQQQQ